MRIGLFFKYDREVVNGSENRDIPDLWGRVDRYVVMFGFRDKNFLLWEQILSYKSRPDSEKVLLSREANCQVVSLRKNGR